MGSVGIGPVDGVEIGHGDRCGQMLEGVFGKSQDMFRTRDGAFVEPGYFESMLYFRDWVRRFQVVQKSYNCVVFRIAKSGSEYESTELDEISARTKLVMGTDCEVTYEFVDEISASASGKYRTAVCEIEA